MARRSVFELNAPSERGGEIFSRDGKTPGFAGGVGQIPELHIADHRRTPGSPDNGRRAKLFLERARLALREGEICAKCPAASLIAEGAKGPGIRCGIEREPIWLHENPSSLLNLCTRDAGEPGGGYTRCPTWIEEKGRRTAAPLVPEALEGV